jgi:hypothetical protein
MVQHTNGVPAIKYAVRERRLKHISLNDQHVRIVVEIAPCNIDGCAHIEPDRLAAPAAHHVKKAARAAAEFDDMLTCEIALAGDDLPHPRGVPGHRAADILRFELHAGKAIPFVAEAGSIVFMRDESRDTAHDRVTPAVLRAQRPCDHLAIGVHFAAFQVQRGACLRAVQQGNKVRAHM